MLRSHELSPYGDMINQVLAWEGGTGEMADEHGEGGPMKRLRNGRWGEKPWDFRVLPMNSMNFELCFLGSFEFEQPIFGMKHFHTGRV